MVRSTLADRRTCRQNHLVRERTFGAAGRVSSTMKTAWAAGSFLPLATAMSVVLSTPAIAQTPTEHPSAWTISLAMGDYARGNRAAVTRWLSANGYGVPEPKQCGFDVVLRAVCDPPVPYPKVSESGVIGWTLGIERTLTPRASIEVFAATEQSGTAIGRCDDGATPRDPRCTNRFMTLDFGGGSFAALGAVRAGPLHLGVGPALLLANWEMEPAHLGGVWADATYGGGHVPFFARVQYRFYQSTSLSPALHFTSFHPSTLYVGGGFALHIDQLGTVTSNEHPDSA